MGQTELVVGPGWSSSGNVLRVHAPNDIATGRSNVVLSDLTVRGRAGVEANNVLISWSDNVLVERLESATAAIRGRCFAGCYGTETLKVCSSYPQSFCRTMVTG